MVFAPLCFLCNTTYRLSMTWVAKNRKNKQIEFQEAKIEYLHSNQDFYFSDLCLWNTNFYNMGVSSKKLSFHGWHNRGCHDTTGFPIFGRSVYPGLFQSGVYYAHHITAGTPNFFDLPPSLL